MKAILATTMLLVSSISHADVIKCVFTEPFITTTYSMAQQTLKIEDDVMGKAKVIKNVSFQIKGPGRFDLIDKSGKVLQELTLSGNGSDGMSDNVYPYDVKDTSQEQFANNGIGGCSSNYQKTIRND